MNSSSSSRIPMALWVILFFFAVASASPASAVKPRPGITVNWGAPSGTAPGTWVTVPLILNARLGGEVVDLSVIAEPGLEISGALPRYSGRPVPGEPVRFEVRYRVPQTPGPTLVAEAAVRSPAPPGVDVPARVEHAYRVGARLLPGSFARHFSTPPSRSTAVDGEPLVEYPARPVTSASDKQWVAWDRARRIIPAPAPPAPALSPQTFTVGGRFLFRDREIGPTGFIHALPADDPLSPIRRAELEVLSGEQVVAAGETDDEGRYELVLDNSITGSLRVRIMSRVEPVGSGDFRVLRSIGDPSLFSAITAALTSPGAGSDVDFGDQIVEAGSGGEAFNVLDACLAGTDAVQSLIGGVPGFPLKVFWNETSSTGTFYSGSPESRIFLLDEEGYDDSVIIHEYGHFVLYRYSKDDSPGGPHVINDSNQDPRLSWSEGWASFWQSFVRDREASPYPTWYVDTAGLPGQGNLFFSYDCEGPTVGVSGGGNEVVVQSLLWDIIDGTESPDHTPGFDDELLDLPASQIWEVINGPMLSAQALTLEDFWDGWFSPPVSNGFDDEMADAFAFLRVEYVIDPWEPDQATAAVLPLDGTSLHRTFYPAGDEDLHAFEAEMGDVFTIETRNLIGPTDTRLEILDPELAVIAVSDDRAVGDRSSLLSFTATRAGIHFARVTRSFGGLAFFTVYGSYDIRAVRGSAVAVPFSAAAASVGIDGASFSVGAAFADYNGDDAADLLVVNNAQGVPPADLDQLYRNLGGGTFTVATGAAALGLREGGIALAWGDYDNDGDPDVFLTDHALYRNNGDGTFSDATAASGIADLGREFDASWADVDRDGYLDLFVAMRDVPSALWHNNGDGTFANIAAGAGLDFPADGGDAYGCAWGDYNGDGLPDLFVAYLSTRGQALLRNLGDNQFEDATVAAGLESNAASVCGLWADFDGDGRLDLYVTATGPNRLYLNQGDGTFSEEAARFGINDAGATRGASAADYDLDGDLDLYVVNFNGSNVLYQNLGTAMLGTLQAVGTGLGHSCAWADPDGDGDADLYVSRQPDNGGLGSANLYFNNQLNDGGDPRPWLKIRLQGEVSNRDGIGAKVRLYAGDQVQFREVGSGVGWASKSRVPELFGIPDGATMDSVRVDWPSGAFNVVVPEALNTTLVINEDILTPVLPTPAPAPLRVGPARPNPFFGAMSLQFTLSEPARIQAEIFDIRGRQVRTLLDRRMTVGNHVLGWDGTDDAGRRVSPGIYFYRFESASEGGEREVITRKLVRAGH